MNKTGREIHAKADHAREDGNFLEALQLIEEATLLYSKEKDMVSFSEIQGSRFLTLRHLFEKTHDTQYLILAKFAAYSAAELAEKSGIKTAIALPYFNLAKAHEALSEYSEAIDAYKKAILFQTQTPDSHHARPAILNDMKVHLAVCEYKNGDASALNRADSALLELEKDTIEGSYTKDVWVSGGHMKLAEALHRTNKQLSQLHLEKAKEIVDANSDLKLRKEQWLKLSASLK